MDSHRNPFTYYEFFAGGGMATAGLGEGWDCLFANDFSVKKASSYIENWGGEHLHVGDVGLVTTAELSGHADLAWASFPCQDLSLAGAGAGLQGKRSGTFWPFWKLMLALGAEARAPKVVLLENVYGALTSHKGQDFAAICQALSSGGYRFGAMVVDAVHFVPQSRPRLFFIAVHKSVPIPNQLMRDSCSLAWTPKALAAAHKALPTSVKANWIWLDLPSPPKRKVGFTDIIQSNPKGVAWHTPDETARLLSMMTEINLAKVEQAKKVGRKIVGGVYRRTRNNVQRTEVRFDDIAGCLRTPGGGSSRQSIIVVNGPSVRSRLLSTREAARLMGLPDEYKLPNNYNQAYHLCGDGVAVPVVRHLAEHIIEPLLRALPRTVAIAAE